MARFAGLNHLPRELLLDISERVGEDVAALGILRQVNPYLSNVLARPFYRTIKLDDSLPAAQALGLFECLYKRDYAAHTQYFRVSWDASDSSVNPENLSAALIAALHHMPDLRTLRITACATRNGVLEDLFANAVDLWPQLIDLRVDGLSSMSFLRQAPNLRNIFLQSLLLESQSPVNPPLMVSIGLNDNREAVLDIQDVGHPYELQAMHAEPHISQTPARWVEQFPSFADVGDRSDAFLRVQTVTLLDWANWPHLTIPHAGIVQILLHFFPNVVTLQVGSYGSFMHSFRIAAVLLDRVAVNSERILRKLDTIVLDGHAFVWSAVYGRFVTSPTVFPVRIITLESEV